MIKRFEDYSIFSNDTLEKLAEIVEKKENTVVYDIKDSEEQAVLIKKQLQLKGYNVEIKPFKDKFKITASVVNKIKLEDARKSGAFKKLAWGRYCFQRESAIGLFKYDFDDGSIWKVMKAENGEEYLVKEVDETNSNEIVRSKVANNNSQDLVNDSNVKNIIGVIYNLEDKDDIVNDILNSNIKNEFYKILNAKFNDKINNILLKNHFIQTPEYTEDVKSIITTAVNNNQINSMNQLEDLISEYTNELINSAGKNNKLFI